jgi:aminoglycoside phosphotransferase (APT) family kinase protein
VFRRDFVLRTCRDNNEERMAREYRALKTLKVQGIPVPTAIALELDRNIIGAPFMIMEKINGASVSNFLGDKENALAIVDMLAKLLASLHKVDPKILFRTDLSRNMLGQTVEFSERVLSELRERINIGYITSFSPFVRRKYLGAVMKLEKAKIQGFPLALIHADFGPDHVLLSDSGPVITDWEGIRWGDPAYDVGWVYHAIKLEGQIMIDHRFVKASKQAPFDFDVGEEFVKCYKRYNGSIPANLEFYKNLIRSNWLLLLTYTFALDSHAFPGSSG